MKDVLKDMNIFLILYASGLLISSYKSLRRQTYKHMYILCVYIYPEIISMETSVAKLQTFFVTKIVRKNDQKRERVHNFSKRKTFLRKRGVKKAERRRLSELRKILSRKTYSIMM